MGLKESVLGRSEALAVDGEGGNDAVVQDRRQSADGQEAELQSHIGNFGLRSTVAGSIDVVSPVRYRLKA